jgi:hypothetical protein
MFSPSLVWSTVEVINPPAEVSAHEVTGRTTPEENYEWSARITRQENVVVINIWVVTNICVHKCPSIIRVINCDISKY